MKRLALWLGIVILVVPQVAAAYDNTQDTLNRAKAAMHGGRYADARAGFERLAQAGNPEAQFYLGRMAAGGMGVSKDLGAAISGLMVYLGDELGLYKVISADVSIQPELSDFTWTDFDRSVELVEKGVEAAEAALPELKRLVRPGD